VAESASFLPADPSELVEASLACPTCLAGEIDWVLDDEPLDASALCMCRRCGRTRLVYLTADQTLRLVLHPPGV
jgi:hypothetical protein